MDRETCQAGMVTQYKCRRVASADLEIGLKSGKPIKLCKKCAEKFLSVRASYAKA